MPRFFRIFSIIARAGLRGSAILPLVLVAWSQAMAADYDLTKFKPASLSYKASKFFVTAETRVQQRLIPSEQAVGQLLVLSQDETQGEGQDKAMMPNQEQIILQTIETSLMGQQSKIEVWLNPDASILQRSSLYTGRKNWFRTYRYIPDGAYSVKRQPASKAEQSRPHTQWSDVSSHFYHLQDVPLDHPLSETEALFYLISVAPLNKPGDRLQLPVFDKDEVIALDLVVERMAPLTVNFKEITTQGQRVISGKRNVIQARLRAHPLGQKSNASNFQFLGYNGDVELFIDPERRVIVQMSGKYDYLGQVDILLQELDYR